jgi:hypothetical protein
MLLLKRDKHRLGQELAALQAEMDGLLEGAAPGAGAGPAGAGGEQRRQPGDGPARSGGCGLAQARPGSAGLAVAAQAQQRGVLGLSCRPATAGAGLRPRWDGGHATAREDVPLFVTTGLGSSPEAPRLQQLLASSQRRLRALQAAHTAECARRAELQHCLVGAFEHVSRQRRNIEGRLHGLPLPPDHHQRKQQQQQQQQQQPWPSGFAAQRPSRPSTAAAGHCSSGGEGEGEGCPWWVGPSSAAALARRPATAGPSGPGAPSRVLQALQAEARSLDGLCDTLAGLRAQQELLQQLLAACYPEVAPAGGAGAGPACWVAGGDSCAARRTLSVSDDEVGCTHSGQLADGGVAEVGSSTSSAAPQADAVAEKRGPGKPGGRGCPPGAHWPQHGWPGGSTTAARPAAPQLGGRASRRPHTAGARCAEAQAQALARNQPWLRDASAIASDFLLGQRDATQGASVPALRCTGQPAPPNA